MGPFNQDDFARLTLRDQLVPMVAEVMRQVHWQGLEPITWDVVTVLAGSQLITGVMIAVRGVDLVGPQRELVRFEPLRTWRPSQGVVNTCVATCVEGLREFRASQARVSNGPGAARS